VLEQEDRLDPPTSKRGDELSPVEGLGLVEDGPHMTFAGLLVEPVQRAVAVPPAPLVTDGQ
jgi:hypothetical protein